ncbi:MAG: 3-phosphoshikimate 1-carboxyvinyltransferase [Opitutus sp.]|nr:3-phosphoshikimate 1-carboxyvinyltransferase [Opitutus sp.]MCS6248228.1 3-phosphoshikimate 1-carboxyvinyltransferase [Opitutus sp.]MCS6273864.1 3-phosphoshikimate 1-carboxyvinyltransferase [Opitutus sp.]MCS6279028.1 3-phosphoshikimate 1-carboxyvinyltransferase [Opitutus sp.]MCS6298777.1 3-phosphoshikimate 1-carboxyvinyltransferase [Opitutus sp.]
MSPSLPALLPIQPFSRPVRGEVTLPGSKSLTNRALLLAALCPRPVNLTGALFSEDTHLMIEALRALGITVNPSTKLDAIEVSGQADAFQNPAPVDLFVGLAGTAARFLTALCAAAPRGVYRIDGIPQMRKRPMKGLIDALRDLGADLRCTGEEGFFPIEIHAHGLRGGVVAIDASESSQMLSGLLMVAPLAKAPVSIRLATHVREPFVQMTKCMIEQFGGAAAFDADAQAWKIPTQPYSYAGDYAIEPDATAASYYAALPLVTGGALTLRNLHPGLQGDTRFVDVLQSVGLTANKTPRGLDVAFTSGAPRRGVDEDFNEFSDTFLTLAAIAPLLAGPTRITGIAHSRKQETDRVAGMVRELQKLGQDVDEHADGDGLTITPRPLRTGVEIETYGDHRFAMSFGILGCHDLHGDGRSWITIKDPACCVKTFPHFFALLESLRPQPLVA